MTFNVTLQKTKEALLKFPKESLRGFTPTEFEKAIVSVLEEIIGCPVDYQEGSQRFPDVVYEDIGLECKKSIRGWKALGNSIKQSRRPKDLVEIWLIFLNQKICDIRYAAYEDCVAGIYEDIRYRHIIDMRGNLIQEIQ